MTALPIIEFAVSEDAIPITAGVAKFNSRLRKATTPVYVSASLTVPQSSGPKLTIDVKKGGVSIFSTPVTFDNGNPTTANALAPAVLLGTAFAFDDQFTVGVTQIGDGTAKGLKVAIWDDITGIVFPPPLVPPPPPTQSWRTVSAPALGLNTGSIAGYVMRQGCAKAEYPTIPAGASKIRLTLKAGAVTALSLTKIYAGPGTTAPNASAMTQITIGGNPGVSLAAGASIVSDEIAYSFDTTKDLVVAFEGSGTVAAALNAPNWLRYSKAGSNESQLASVSGYAADGYQLLVSKVEVYA